MPVDTLRALTRPARRAMLELVWDAERWRDLRTLKRLVEDGDGPA